MIAARLRASEGGRLEVAASLFRDRYVLENAATVGNNTGLLKLRATTAESDGINFSAAARIVAHGGECPRFVTDNN